GQLGGAFFRAEQAQDARFRQVDPGRLETYGLEVAGEFHRTLVRLGVVLRGGVAVFAQHDAHRRPGAADAQSELHEVRVRRPALPQAPRTSGDDGPQPLRAGVDEGVGRALRRCRLPHLCANIGEIFHISLPLTVL